MSDGVGVGGRDDRAFEGERESHVAARVASASEGARSPGCLDVSPVPEQLGVDGPGGDRSLGPTSDEALWAELAGDGLVVRSPEVTVGGVPRRRRAGVEALAMDVLGLLVAIMVGAAFAVGAVEVERHGPGGGAVFGGTLLRLLVCLPVLVVALASTRQPVRAQLRSTMGWHMGQVVGSLGVGGLASLVLWQVVHLSGVSEPSVDAVLVTCVASVVTVGGCRSIGHGAPRRKKGRARRVVVVGSGVVAGRVAQCLGASGDVVVGFVDDDPIDRERWLGKLEHLSDVCQRSGADHVVVAFSMAPAKRLLDALRPLQGTLPISVIPRLFDVLPASATVTDLGAGIPALTMAPSTLGWWPTMLKRTVDVVGAAAALIALSPVLLAAALAVRLSSRGPVVLRQRRIGRYGEQFTMVKFRTMVVDRPRVPRGASTAEVAEGPFFKLKCDPRVTRVGRWLRRTSIDELPQLLNVLLGQMSLVGPRPFLPEDSAHIRGWASRRYSVRPGVTGLWQVSGRNDLTFDDMCRLDHLYVACWSFGLDLRILARTVRAVLAGHGAY